MTVGDERAVIIHDFELAFMGHTSEEVTRRSTRPIWHGGRNRPHAQRGHHTPGMKEGLGRANRSASTSIVTSTSFRTSPPASRPPEPDWDFLSPSRRRRHRYHSHASVRGRCGNRRRITARFSPLAAVVSRDGRRVSTSTPGSAVILPEVFLKAVSLDGISATVDEHHGRSTWDFSPIIVP